MNISLSKQPTDALEDSMLWQMGLPSPQSCLPRFAFPSPVTSRRPGRRTPSHHASRSSSHSSRVPSRTSQRLHPPVSRVQPFDLADGASPLDHEITLSLPHCLSIFTCGESENKELRQYVKKHFNAARLETTLSLTSIESVSILFKEVTASPLGQLVEGMEGTMNIISLFRALMNNCWRDMMLMNPRMQTQIMDNPVQVPIELLIFLCHIWVVRISDRTDRTMTTDTGSTSGRRASRWSGSWLRRRSGTVAKSSRKRGADDALRFNKFTGKTPETAQEGLHIVEKRSKNPTRFHRLALHVRHRGGVHCRQRRRDGAGRQ